MDKVIIDVREPEEYAGGHVEGAINIPLSKLMGDLPGLSNVSKDTEIILYCRTGSRSSVAMHILRTKGYTNPINGINQAQVKARYL
jgi:phage shock protein E